VIANLKCLSQQEKGYGETTIARTEEYGTNRYHQEGDNIVSVIVNLAIFPLDCGASVSAYVSKAVAVIENSGLPHHFGPMSTCIEGEWDEVMEVVDRCFMVLQKDSNRIYITMTADYRKGRANGLEGKVKSVRSKIGEGNEG